MTSLSNVPNRVGVIRPAADHEVVLTNREKLTIKGVNNVDSFDEKEIILQTDLGVLSLKGENLQIKQLDLEQGCFAVEGLITSLQYSVSGRDIRDRGKGFLERLLK